MTNKIFPFYSGVFSQWHKCKFSENQIEFNCAEQYMMYCKAILFNDCLVADQILETKSSHRQKELGRKIKCFNEETWRLFRFGIVYNANLLKFSQNDFLLDALLKTGNSLIAEASPIDRVWGVGIAIDDERIWDVSRWRGLNLLGIALTQVREALRWPN